MSFVEFAQNKDAASFKKHFEDAIQSAVSSALEDEKVAVAQSMFGEPQQAEEQEEEVVEEQAEQIDEVTPPGREKQVKALKKVPGIDNPWAVAWASYNKSKKK